MKTPGSGAERLSKPDRATAAIPPSELELLEAPPDLRFDGRVVWITGASRGLGRALALALAGSGAELALSSRSTDALTDLASLLESHGAKARAITASVSDPADIATAVTTIEREFGKLDVLVNNAGISPYFSPAESLKEDELRDVLETNLIGAFACCRAALPLLEAGDLPCVVNISSIHSSRAHERLLAYAAAKGGLEMVTRTLAEEWAGRGIRVNSLAPGYAETSMTEGLRSHKRWREELLGRTPLGRFATAAEVAACAMFLASPAASYVTGATLLVDGGWSIR